MNGTLKILANRRDVNIDTKWNGSCRVWTVKDRDGVFLFTTDDYELLIGTLENNEVIRAGVPLRKWWLP